MNTRKIKITAAQIIALREASMSVDGMYAVGTAKGQTVSALIRAGVVVPGTRLLTVQGVSVMHSVSHVDVIASKGHSVYVSDAPESLATFVLPPRTEGVEESATDAMGDAENGAQSVDGGSVTIQGAEGFDMTPDMSALTGECYMGCGRPVTGMFTDYVGRTEGVCDFDRDSLGDHITVTPVDPSIWGGASETGVAMVCVVQNTPGMNGRSHYHAPGCRDIAREMRHWGQKQSDVLEASFSDVVEILEFEYGDISANEFEIGSAEYWADIIHNATIDDEMGSHGFGVKVMPCLDIPAGRTPNGPLVTQGGFYRIGFDQPTPERVAEIRAEIDAHTCDESECITCIVRDMNREQIPSVEEFPNERAYKSGTENANDYVRDAGLIQYGEEWQNTFRSSYALSMEIQATENDDTDGGFVETLITKEYELSVIVDETTGASVSLGWVTLTMNTAQQHDYDRVAEEYGRVHGTGTPRHGWASIIRVHDVADI